MAENSSDFGQPIPGYEVLELIGSGGAGSVYRARQSSLGREVALKVLRRDRAEQKTSLERTAKEARLLARLDHPNIVRSIDFGQAGDLMYFTMEYVDGQSAKQLLQERGDLPLLDVVQIGEEVARALDHAARQGVTHRDVKPGNILLARDGAVKLSDFGLARADLDRSLTRDGTTVGTPQYMAPEQVKYARRADLRSDLYSLGATLYHLATGHAPFEGDSVAEILHQVLYARPIPPEQLRPEVPVGLSRLLARLMARNPARRYPDAGALLRDLARVRAGLEDQDAESGEVGLSWQDAAEPPRLGARRTAWVASAFALVALGVTLGLVFSGEDSSVDPASRRVQEQTVLSELEGELDSGARSPLEVLASLHAFRRDGTLTAISGVPRQELEEESWGRVEQALENAAGHAFERVQGPIAAARLGSAAEDLRREFDAEIRLSLGAETPDPDSLGEFDYPAAREGALQRAQQRLNELEQRLLLAVQSGVERAKRSLIVQILGGPGEEGMLGRGEFEPAQALLVAVPEELATAMRDAFVDAASGEGLRPPADLTYAALLGGFPEVFRRERESDPFLATLEAEWRDAVRAVQVELVEAIDELEPQHVARIDGGEIEPTVDDWERVLREALRERGFPLATLPVEPVEWSSRITAYRDSVASHRTAAVTAWRGQRIEDLLNGSEGQPGLIESLERHDVPAAVAQLADFDNQRIEEIHQAWREPVEELGRWWVAVDRALASRDGQDVTLRDDRGRQHSGRLQYHGPARRFQVGPRVELSLGELHLEALQELAGIESVSPVTRAVLLAFWGGRPDELGEHLDTLDSGNSVVQVLRERLERARTASAEADRAAHAEVDELLARARAAESEGRFDDALAVLETLRSSGRLRRTARYRELRAELDAWQRELQKAGSHTRVGDALRPQYSHAADFAVLPDGRIRLLYDFADASQGEDFDLGGAGVLVANQAMRFEAEPGSSRFRVWGPNLPLAVDRDQAFRLRVDLYSPFEQEEPPRFVLVQAGGICVGLYAPRGVRLSFAPQLAVWEGSLDDYSERFYDPSLASEPRQGQVVRNVGLDRARNQTLEIRYDPSAAKAITVYLDDKLVQAVGAGRLDRPPTRMEVRTPDALHVQRLEFIGALRTQ